MRKIAVMGALLCASTSFADVSADVFCKNFYDTSEYGIEIAFGEKERPTINQEEKSKFVDTCILTAKQNCSQEALNAFHGAVICMTEVFESFYKLETPESNKELEAQVDVCDALLKHATKTYGGCVEALKR